jgi:hypothetical protein
MEREGDGSMRLRGFLAGEWGEQAGARHDITNFVGTRAQKCETNGDIYIVSKR